MTQQVSDYLIWKRKKFVLIEIEYDTTLLNFDEIQMVEDKQKTDLDEMMISTACYRGYQAKYEIIDSQVFVKNYILSGEYKFSKHNEINMPITFTGGILVARNGKWEDNSDVLFSVFEYKEVYELKFENGKLVKVHDLSRMNELVNEKLDMLGDDIYDFMLKSLELFTILKYYKAKETYKWRTKSLRPKKWRFKNARLKRQLYR